MNPIYEFLAPASKTINNLSLVFFLKLLNCWFQAEIFSDYPKFERGVIMKMRDLQSC